MPQFVNVRRIMLGHKRAAKSPLLQKFIDQCVKEEKNNFVSSMDVLNEYKHAVELWTEGDNQAKILLKEKAFQRQFKKAILHNCKGWEVAWEVRSGRRGFQGIKLTRPSRSPTLQLDGPGTARAIHNFVANPPTYPPIELHEVPTDPRNAGVCAFASRDIERGEVVVEYEGEVIGLEEAREREKRYEEEERMCTLMFLESRGDQVAIDPYGNERDEMTWGATINHSKHNANLRPVVMDRNSQLPRVFFVALKDIPQLTEFLWDYKDPHWEFEENSQTLQ